MRAFALTSLLLLIPTFASAQLPSPITTVVLTKDVRLGTFISASVIAPPGTESIGIKDTMNDADASDETKHGRLLVEASVDGVSGWRIIQSDQWNGGTYFDKRIGQDAPNHIDFSFGVGVGTMDGQAIRVTWDIQTKINTGLKITLR